MNWTEYIKYTTFRAYTHSSSIIRFDFIRYKLKTSFIVYTLFKVQFALLYLLIFIEIIVQHASTKIVPTLFYPPYKMSRICMISLVYQFLQRKEGRMPHNRWKPNMYMKYLVKTNTWICKTNVPLGIIGTNWCTVPYLFT